MSLLKKGSLLISKVDMLKDLRNANRKLFLCPPQKWAKAPLAF